MNPAKCYFCYKDLPEDGCDFFLLAADKRDNEYSCCQDCKNKYKLTPKRVIKVIGNRRKK